MYFDRNSILLPDQLIIYSLNFMNYKEKLQYSALAKIRCFTIGKIGKCQYLHLNYSLVNATKNGITS